MTTKPEVTGRKGAGSRTLIMFRPELLALFGGITPPTVWLWMQKRGFPRPVVIGGRSAWYRREVEDWIKAQPRRRIKGDV